MLDVKGNRTLHNSMVAKRVNWGANEIKLRLVKERKVKGIGQYDEMESICG